MKDEEKVKAKTVQKEHDLQRELTLNTYAVRQLVDVVKLLIDEIRRAKVMQVPYPVYPSNPMPVPSFPVNPGPTDPTWKPPYYSTTSTPPQT